MFKILTTLSCLIAFSGLCATDGKTRSEIIDAFYKDLPELSDFYRPVEKTYYPRVLGKQNSSKNSNREYFLEFVEQEYDKLTEDYMRKSNNPELNAKEVILYYNALPRPVARPFYHFLMLRADIKNYLIETFHQKGRILLGAVGLGHETGFRPKEFFFDFEANKMLERLEFEGRIGLISLRKGVISDESIKLKHMHLWVQNKNTLEKFKILTFDPSIISEVLDIGKKLDIRFKKPYQKVIHNIVSNFIIERARYDQNYSLRDNLKNNNLTSIIEVEFKDSTIPRIFLYSSRKFLDSKPKGLLEKCFHLLKRKGH